jgi:hypothetical protein
MRAITISLFLSLSILVSGQSSVSLDLLKIKVDSILKEGNLLYQYEKVAWVSTDIALSQKNIKKNYGGYFVYIIGDTIKSIILGKDKIKCIKEFMFVKNVKKPDKAIDSDRYFTDYEKLLLSIREKVINEINQNSTKYGISCPEGFNINIDLIPSGKNYKVYLITGTSESDVIPIGNDYLFTTDDNGSIVSWKKFHSKLLPQPAKGPNGENIRECTHSHLRIEPYISATDICTFKLYGSLFGLNEFSVYSTSLSKYFKYNLKKDKIEIAD